MDLKVATPGMNLASVSSLRLGNDPAEAGILAVQHASVLRRDLLDALAAGQPVHQLVKRLTKTNALAAKCMRLSGANIAWH
jgi:hypothetical protein